ncbi:MarR family winged helix-turn-helix transcriptional regulator [uncultured Sulfitobacter sp.]|uniref:MarR family winged helix-turn-helix transcriptional regulator n=1 Tax=uncultured Sulfitobacter sp. TaxID=191468 RepID=UPI0026155A81|nr:MarR family winged helix-turn-helix transcriptional regulator [uncultured Sulfitobacter sp.]
MNDLKQKDFNPQLAQLNHFLTYRISRLHQKLNTQATKILSDSVGVTLNQWRMVAFIGGAETVTASELVRYTAMDKGLVSRNVKSLIAEGLVASSEHAKDNRVHVLSLTSEGKEVFDTALPKMRRRQENLQTDLSAEDVANLRRMLAILERAAEKVET